MLFSNTCGTSESTIYGTPYSNETRIVKYTAKKIDHCSYDKK